MNTSSDQGNSGGVEQGERHAVRGGRSDTRLVARLVLSTRPWKIFLNFKYVVAAGFATGAYALVFPTIWQIADGLDQLRLIALMVLGLASLVAWTMLAHGLWERRRHTPEQDPSITPRVQNTVTLLSLVTGVFISYAVLFGLITFVGIIFVSDNILSSQLGHSVNWRTYATLAWTATSVSCFTGALVLRRFNSFTVDFV